MYSQLKYLKKEIKSTANPQKAKSFQRFFKTGKGEYGEGDKFLGITVPIQRQITKRFCDLPLSDLSRIIKSKFHEERLIALLILVSKFEAAKPVEQRKIYNFYLKNTKYINNWDLVDLSAYKIVGPYLENKNKAILYRLAKSKSIWERRIAVLSTFHYIKQQKPDEALKIADILINDKHDLIQKAVGWMLREIGKHCGEKIEEKFLKKHYKIMPRTVLRYAIERFPENKKRLYMA